MPRRNTSSRSSPSSTTDVNRYTIQDDFAKSLYFLDGKLANGTLDAYRKDDIIRRFLTNTSASEIDVDVKKVALEELQAPPYRARVDFYMVYYSPADHSELKRDLYTANFVFVFQSPVPNELIPINPLGYDMRTFGFEFPVRFRKDRTCS
jgi:hypothetical protein